MGNADSKASFRQALLQLTSKSQPVDPSDARFWDQFWSESVASVEDVFAQTPAADIRALREEMPANMATVCFKAVEKLLKASETGCSTQQEQQTVLNCVRVLTRLLPYIFEDSDWSGFFWTSARPAGEPQDGPEPLPLAQTLMVALCDLLFCPDFTVTPSKAGAGVDQHEDVQSIDSCEYIWEAGVGFSSPVTHSSAHDSNRTEILKLLLTCFSQTMYLLPSDGAQAGPNRWVQFFTSAENRHALPLFTSLLNLVCAYDPVGMGLPYNHLLFNDKREALMETALQILIVTLDHDSTASRADDERSPDNLFINYLSRIHREEDFDFILKGFTRLLNNPLTQTYLPHSTKKVHAHQELLVFFWKCCDYNKGTWYEVGKIQTPGGAAFQKDCVCDALVFHSDEPVQGDGEVTYACRYKTVDGIFTNMTADLIYEGTPGNFNQKFRFPFAPLTDYNLVLLDEDAAIEYDCSPHADGTIDYCIHFISRTPSLSEDRLQALIDLALGMGLNTQDLAYKANIQDGCWRCES
ncbi:Protein HID1 [Amphibalanus amphitrite]|uniref:Protein HID1 n=1 Tax=Amphibalanus amphitrite TaxID=1232801 RepID=A0A6A4X2A2_AMPAM|nr:Protein HID1 [Amphibalanus amphitrite]